MFEFDEEDVSGLATMGEDGDDVDMDVVGALVRKAARGLRRKPRALAGPVVDRARAAGMLKPAWMGNLTGQGISRASEELDTLPFRISNQLTLVTPTAFAEAFPQRPFRGERVIAQAILADTANPGQFQDAGGLVQINPAIFVGAVQVGASQGGTPLSTFSPVAFGVRLSLPAAGQGTRFYIPFQSIVPLSATQSITVTLSIIGRAVR